VLPRGLYLFETPCDRVPELCDAFKLRQDTRFSESGGRCCGKTPYAGATPGRTPALSGMATPGRASIRQTGRTPTPTVDKRAPFCDGRTTTPAQTGYAQTPWLVPNAIWSENGPLRWFGQPDPVG